MKSADFPDEDKPMVDPDFTTIVCDGAYTHFQEGFVSLLFYQDEVVPVNLIGKTRRGKRVILFETRLSINQAKLLVDEISSGIRTYNSMGLFPGSRSFWPDKPAQPGVGEYASLNFTEKDEEQIVMATVMSLAEQLPPEGKKEYNEILGGFLMPTLLDHMEEFRKLAQKYGVKIRGGHNDAPK